jgi:molybdate transport system substrate-binding protein
MKARVKVRSRSEGWFLAGVLTVLLTLMVGLPAVAGAIRVAVASNFADAAKEIAGRFEQKSGHEVVLVLGSTGKHYAQIKNGAPFEAFLAADARRPALLEEEGAAQPGTRFTYALGTLVLWSPKADYVDAGGAVLRKGGFRHLALANPKLAPYGKAAQEVMEGIGLWQALQSRMVRGENIGQTFQFVKSGNAELGFVAWSQIRRPDEPATGSWWEIPQRLYSPIEQQAVLLDDNPVARDFLAFVRAEEGREIIRTYGYGTP